jgi:hypothetical protein
MATDKASGFRDGYSLVWIAHEPDDVPPGFEARI